ncbi:hypothetical protein K488DRAFT_20393, partial [Vararia minispora EC-137]
DPSVIREELARQMQIYALNNAHPTGAMSDSTLSPSSTPFPGPAYNPWTFLQTSRVYGAPPPGASLSTASMRSSPSHEPLPLPTRPSTVRRPPNMRPRRPRPPPRVQSTQPRDTSPELSDSDSSGEETAGQEDTYLSSSSTWLAADAGGGELEKEWVDEGLDADGEDMLELEFHTEYVMNPEKRRKRWEVRWNELLRNFSALDRETDATMILLAAPPHGTRLRCVASRGLRRAPFSLQSAGMSDMRQLFGKLSAQRAAARPQVASLVERLASSGAGEEPEDLRRALDTALRGLSALGHIYEEREMR